MKRDPESEQRMGMQSPREAENTPGNDDAHDGRSRGPRPGQRLLGLHEAAGYLGCCEKTVRDLILDGAIPEVKLTSRIQVDINDLDRLIESRKKVHSYED